MIKKNWRKIDKKTMSKIYGGGFLFTFWSLSLATALVVKSLFSSNASVGINGVGRASWNAKNNNLDKSQIVKNNTEEEFKNLKNFVNKFYEI